MNCYELLSVSDFSYYLKLLRSAMLSGKQCLLLKSHLSSEKLEFVFFFAEFQKIAMATAIGFAIMGFIGFFVKLIHIPINNIIV